MSWLVSIFVALLTGIVSIVVGGIVLNACVSWYHITSREGAAGYFVVFNAMAIGVVGTIGGFIIARIIGAYWSPGFFKELGGSIFVVLVIAGVSSLAARLLADVPPTIGGNELSLEVEFRFPNTLATDAPPTTNGKWNFVLGSISNHTRRDYREGEVHDSATRLEQGRWIVPTEAFLFTERGSRGISLTKDDKDEGGFLVPLPRRPSEQYEQWSDWLPSQQVDGSAWPDDKMSYRFRVQKIPFPPPPKSEADWQAEEDARKEAEFVAIAPDAPLETYFTYISYDQPQTQRALQAIANRPNLIADLEKLIAGDNAQMACDALRCIDKLSEPTKEMIALVEQAGRDIATRITEFNSMPVDQDPSYQAASDVSLRFSGWITAARKLREKCGGDFVPELQKILELSRVRTDSAAVQMDVRRVASYYLHQWAGIQPLPTDPKPR